MKGYDEFEGDEYEQEIDSGGQELDDENDEFWTEHGMPAPATLRLSYESGSGEKSDRKVDVKLFADSAWGPLIIGRCHTRNATRTFKIERINTCFDESSGIYVDDVYNHLFDLYEKTPEYSFHQVSTKHADMLRAALHMADCASLTATERLTVIRQICHQLSGDRRIGQEPVSRFISHYSGDKSDGVNQTFRLIAGRLSKSLSPGDKDSAVRLCTKIANIKGQISSGSQESIEYLVKRFNS